MIIGQCFSCSAPIEDTEDYAVGDESIMCESCWHNLLEEGR